MHSRRFIDSTIIVIDIVITINFITSSNLVRAKFNYEIIFEVY